MPVTTPKPKKTDLFLISAPWPLFNRPSIQLGALKAYITEALPGVAIAAHHLFLLLAQRLGYQTYQEISQRTWLAESVYAALLFPEKKAAAESLFAREARSNPNLRKREIDAIIEAAAGVAEEFIAELPERAPLLAGFSISYCQLSASLYLIKRIKRRFPDLPVVVGGASVAGDAGRDLQRLFPQIDFVVQGEGEIPLTELLKYLRNGVRIDDLPSIKGIIRTGRKNRAECFDFSNQIRRLDNLPTPDYDDYFVLLNGFPPAQRFFPVLPVEASRGCWWQEKPAENGLKGCAFCNLNLQWQGYRSKSAERTAAQIQALVRRYQILSVAFMDNVLPPNICRSLFKKLSELDLDLKLFAEIRARTPDAVMRQMQQCGMAELQIGIEALSTVLLRRMNKGTRAIDNIAAMKACQAQGIVNASNLLIQFPGSTGEEVTETLRALEFVQPFQPLRPVRFWLGLGSPVHQRPKAFGLKAVFNHPDYRHLFPEDLYARLTLTIQGYRGDIQHQRRLWKPVVEKVAQWRRNYAEMTRGNWHDPPLHYRDGGDFLIIIQRRPNREPLKHRLTGRSRSIYLFCQKHRSLKRILGKFPILAEGSLRSFLAMMVSKKLMFEEQERYLSLAVPLRY